MNKNLIRLTCFAMIVFGVLAFYRLAEWSSRGGEQSPIYSVYRHDHYGTAALKDLLVERGVKTHILNRPFLDEEDKGVLIRVLTLGEKAHSESGFFLGHQQLGCKALRNWIVRGNTAVIFSRGRMEILDDCIVAETETETDETGSETSKIKEHPFGKEVRRIEELQAAGKSPDKISAQLAEAEWVSAPNGSKIPGPLALMEPFIFDEEDIKNWRPLAQTPQGVVAGELLVGKGRVILVGAPTPALNGELEKGGNLTFILELISDEPVIFDEWSHGIGHGGSIIGLIQWLGLMPLIFQLFFVIALYIWSARGYKQIDQQGETRRSSYSDQIDTLGYLYSKTLSNDETLENIRNEIMRRLDKSLRRTSIRDIDEALHDMKEDKAIKVKKLLSLVDSFNVSQKGRQLNTKIITALTISHELTEELSNDRWFS